MTRSEEVKKKLAWMRKVLISTGVDAIRLRGVDWFAWATGGGSNVVILTDECGVAEILVTKDAAFVLTDGIENDRMRREEISPEYKIAVVDWSTAEGLDLWIKRELGFAARIASDRPKTQFEQGLPAELVAAKRALLPSEIVRYRELGRDATQAMTEVLTEAQPDWTEQELAGVGARALWARGIHPALTLAGGERRVVEYRHPTPTAERIGNRAMLVFCGRRHGLYANLSRFIRFTPWSSEERGQYEKLAEIEAVALNASRSGETLAKVYAMLTQAYARFGFRGEELRHHQGGLTGYLSREVIAKPSSAFLMELGNAVAWNPSLAGMKLEDTFLLTESGLENLTLDSRWPSMNVGGRERPLEWVRGTSH